MNFTLVPIGFYILYIAYRHMMLNHPSKTTPRSQGSLAKPKMDIIINGRYYKHKSNWIAEIPAFNIKTSNQNPFLALRALKELISLDLYDKDIAVLVKDDGELLLVLPESPVTYDLIAKYLTTDKLNEIQIADPFKERQ